MRHLGLFPDPWNKSERFRTGRTVRKVDEGKSSSYYGHYEDVSSLLWPRGTSRTAISLLPIHWLVRPEGTSMCKTMRIWLVLSWLLFLGSIASAATILAGSVKSDPPYDKSRALVIGIEQYAQAQSVPGAVEEAKLFAQAYRQLGFEEIIELYNKDATSRRLHQALTDIFTRKVERKGRVVVFFAGHTGIVRDSKGRDQGYFVPADAQINKAAKSLTIETFREFTR